LTQARAARLRLVNHVVPAAGLVDAALAFAAELATKPPLTLAAALSAVHRGMDASIDDGLAIVEAAFAGIVPTHDARRVSQRLWKSDRLDLPVGDC
jgi:enoyl-CoA hydratase